MVSTLGLLIVRLEAVQSHERPRQRRVQRGLLVGGRASPERQTWAWVAVIRMESATSDQNYVSSGLFVKPGFVHTTACSRIWVYRSTPLVHQPPEVLRPFTTIPDKS